MNSVYLSHFTQSRLDPKIQKFNSSLILLDTTAVLNEDKGRIEEKTNERNAFSWALQENYLAE